MKLFLSFLSLICLVLLQQACYFSNTSNIKVEQIKADLPDDQKERWRLMTGLWYGSQPIKKGGKKEWLIKRDESGFYEIRFRNHLVDGSIEERIEVGDWGIAESFYFSIFTGWIINNQFVPADRKDPYNRDIYKVIRLNETLFEYENISTRDRFTVKRVADDFTFSKLK